VVRGHGTKFYYFARLFGGGDPIQAGEFEIKKGMSEAAILDLLQHGRPLQRLITVTEGMPSIIVSEKLAGNRYLTGPLPEIAEGSLLPNDAELSMRFGVSRTVLRETMKTLAAKRLVEPKAKVGTRVLDRSSWNFFDPDVLGWRCEAGIDQEFVKHLAEIRLALEPAAAAAAALQASNDDIVSLYVIAAKFDNPKHTPETIAKVDLEFHLAVAHMSGNPFMRSASGLIEAALLAIDNADAVVFEDYNKGVLTPALIES